MNIYNLNFLFRKLYRIVRTGSAKSKPYLDYIEYLESIKKSYPIGLFNLTIDLELGWSRARRKNGLTSLAESMERSRLIRLVFPEFLSLCNLYNIPVTFAIVGHVAIADCLSHRKPPAFNPYWLESDWFAVDPLTGLENNLDYYGFDLVEKILNSNQKHEIASHGFSHIDLSDDAITSEVAEFEIVESARILKKLDDKLATFIFPNNRPAFINILKDSGFKIYRIGYNKEIERDNLNLWQFPVGLWSSPNSFNAREAVKLLAIAIKKKCLVNFFCHLYEFNNKQRLRNFFQPIFQFISCNQKKGLIEANTVRDLIYK